MKRKFSLSSTALAAGAILVASPATAATIEYLIVGGGGGGGSLNSSPRAAGGGGAGGLLTGTTFVPLGSYTLSVGAGGAGGVDGDRGAPGGDSSALGLTAFGGGGGGSNRSGAGLGPGTDGGSGGGSFHSETSVAGSGESGQGFDGSVGDGVSRGGGGGGAGGAGSFVTGGPGLTIPITGTAITYAVGGDGGDHTLGNLTGVAGLPNTGNGGSGASRQFIVGGFDYSGGDGGSGIVIFRYVGTDPLIESDDDLVSTFDDGGTTYTVHQFTLGSTGNGSGAFSVVPEPSSVSLVAAAGLCLGFLRRRGVAH